jgi:hypothetical protein
MTTTHAPQCTAVTQRQGYQGWKNYPTWAANLWIGEEPYFMSEVARIVLLHKGFSSEPALEQVHAADRIKEVIEDTMSELEGGAKPPTIGLAGDLYQSAWDDIDWLAIVRLYWDYSDADLKSSIEG